MTSSAMKFIDSHTDRWHTVIGEDGPMACPDACTDKLLTLLQWHAVRDHWPAGLNTGVIVPNDADVESLAGDVARLALIVLQFPKFTDGRAYSQAHLLRTRYGYRGELRATGDVLVDMMSLLARTGVDAVQLRADQGLEAAQRALRFFPGHYQGDTLEPQPLFGRQDARVEGTV